MWTEISEKIVSVTGYCLSSKFEKGKIYGQSNDIKTIGFIEILSESGKKGFGENYSAIYVPELLPEIVKYFEKFLIGKEIGKKDLIREIIDIPFVGRNGILRSISGSIEVALWDLRGKILGKPTYKLFKSKRKKIPCYSSGGSVAMNEKEISREVEETMREGFVSYKMRIGLQGLNKDHKRIQAARNALGKKDLMIDAIMGTLTPPWSLNLAIKNIKSLSKFKPRWIEEPLHPNDIKQLGLLKKKSKIPIAAGEAYSGTSEYEIIINSKSVDILQLDCTHSGGVEICNLLSNKCFKKKIDCAVHIWGSAGAISSNLHMSYSLDNLIYTEIPILKLEISDFLWIEKPKFNNGFVELSDVPGLGININDKIKNRFSFIKGSGFRIKK